MQSFLSKVVSDVLSDNTDLSTLTFILPNKRSGLFLKTEIIKQIQNATIFPKIISIEEFVKEVSCMDIMENTPLIFEFYKVYSKCNSINDLDSFDVFSNWASIILQDFNEIDSNIIDPVHLLNYVSDSKRLEHWNLQNNGTALTQNYLKFFEKLKLYYTEFNLHLLTKNLGYQGLVYRKATENINLYIKENINQKFIISGFNALNKAEELIFQKLLANSLAEIYWDTDKFYFNNQHEASKFVTTYRNNWKYYKTNPFNWIDDNLNTAKTIQIIGVPKNITQIKKVGSILKQLNDEYYKLESTAVILGNENLLPVLLNSIPKEIENANITMGYSLQNIPLAHLFDLIFRLHINRSKLNQKNLFYYKDLFAVLKHPSLQKLWVNSIELKLKLDTLVNKNKTIFISENDIFDLLKNEIYLSKIGKLLFTNWENQIETVLQYIISAIDFFRNKESTNQLEIEYLFRFNNIFLQLINLNREFGYIKDIKTLYSVYKQILKTESLSFQGEPLKGLQIMGMLESRVLDFENVIITSVNEGFIPGTNSQNTFIPFDIKFEKGLPTYKEKDSIFAYHFYRLLHRAKNIFILYNTETDDFGSGEQSRFVTQLEIAHENLILDKIKIKKSLIIPNLESNPIQLKKIDKSVPIINQLTNIAVKGFSPSSLSLYIRNPIDFYKQKILKLRDAEEIEESIAANTFGTIIHDTLEVLYMPFKNKYLSKKDLIEMKEKLNGEVTNQFKNHYSSHAISAGKNYLTFEIAKQFLINFLNYEISQLNKNKKIKLLDLEQEIECNYKINALDLNIKLKGKIDRIDEIDGVLRIIDYKTGKVDARQLKINDWDVLITDDKFDKSFQVLLYAFMYCKINDLDLDKINFQSGIISFKNLKSGFMKVNNSNISSNILDNLSVQLDKLIVGLFDQSKPFKEREIKSKLY